MKFSEINVLGNIINTTWGKPSFPVHSKCWGAGSQDPFDNEWSDKAKNEDKTAGGLVTQGGVFVQPKNAPQWIINCKMVNENTLQITYTAIVNYASPSGMQQLHERYVDESVKVIDSFIGVLKKKFKEEAGRDLKCKVTSTSPGVEDISMSAYNPKKTAYFRNIALADVG